VGYRDDEHLVTSLSQTLCEDRDYSNSTSQREGRKNKRYFHLKVPLKTPALDDAQSADARVLQERGRVNVNYRFPDVYIESTLATVENTLVVIGNNFAVISLIMIYEKFEVWLISQRSLRGFCTLSPRQILQAGCDSPTVTC
jgi:hypothetical protein